MVLKSSSRFLIFVSIGVPFLTAQNLPVLVLETETDMPERVAEKEIGESGVEADAESGCRSCPCRPFNSRIAWVPRTIIQTITRHEKVLRPIRSATLIDII